MHYVAFLVLWLAQEDPTAPPKAAFIQHYETYDECEKYRARVKDPEVKKQTACLLLVVEPKRGIKE